MKKHNIEFYRTYPKRPARINSKNSTTESVEEYLKRGGTITHVTITGEDTLRAAKKGKTGELLPTEEDTRGVVTQDYID